MDDKRQPQDAAANQRIGRKSESGREKIFHNGKLFKRVRSEKILIQGKIIGGGLQIGLCQVIRFGKEIGGSSYPAHLFFPNNIGTDRKRQPSDRITDQPGGLCFTVCVDLPF